MAEVIRMHSLHEGYTEVVNTLVDRGDSVSPRGHDTFEYPGPVTLQIDDPTCSLPLGCGRRLLTPLGAAEALQLIGGVSHPALLVRIAPTMAQFMERNLPVRQHGAYGPRAGWQMHDVITLLKRDPDTRQALIGVWDPRLDLNVSSPDIPCTVVLRFAIRDDRLTLMTVMRSNDVWLGLPYDVFQFTQLQLTLARALDVPAGSYWHTALSLHLYKRDLPSVEQLHGFGAPLPLFGVGDRSGMPWEYYSERACELLRGGHPQLSTLTEKWYGDKLRRYFT